jgi:hypothetical protein
MMIGQRFVKPANAIVGQAGAGFDGAGASLVPNHAQGQVMALTIAKISIIADMHGRNDSLLR